MIYPLLFMREDTLLLEHPSWNQNYVVCGSVTQNTMLRQVDLRCPLGRVGSQPLDRNHVPLRCHDSQHRTETDCTDESVRPSVLWYIYRSC